jgi:hypothetical protein
VIDSVSNRPSNPGEDYVIYYRFLGGDIDETYISTLRFEDNCGNIYQKEFEIQVIGTRIFNIETLELIGTPGETIEYPIIITNPISSKLPDIGNYSATLSFNRTILYSDSDNSNINNSNREYVISGNLLEDIDNPQSVSLLVTLGNTESTVIDLQAEFTSDNGYEFKSSNGLFTYDNDYLQNNPGFVDGNIRINFQGPNPNPVIENFNVSFNMIEIGRCKLEVIDIHGNVIKKIVDENLSTGYYEYNINSLKFASGTYYLRFETPTYEKLTPFTVTN